MPAAIIAPKNVQTHKSTDFDAVPVVAGDDSPDNAVTVDGGVNGADVTAVSMIVERGVTCGGVDGREGVAGGVNVVWAGTFVGAVGAG